MWSSTRASTNASTSPSSCRPCSIDDLANRKVLVVDDVADTGETLKLVLQKCAPAVDDVRAAVLYEKPRSIVRSDYVWRRTDRWIDFPWSSEPVIVRTQRSPARGEAAARRAAREPE